MNLTPEVPLRGVRISSNGPRGPYQTPMPVDEKYFLVSHDGTIQLRDYENTERSTVIEALGNGLGYSLILVLVATLRELFGSGTLFGVEVLPIVANGGWYTPNGMMLLAPSAFFLIGFIIWALRTWKPEQVEPEG